jgi:Dormancy/auxin associated protein
MKLINTQLIYTWRKKGKEIKHASVSFGFVAFVKHVDKDNGFIFFFLSRKDFGEESSNSKNKRSASMPDTPSTPATPGTPTTPQKTNVWRSVFHPGSNLATRGVGANIFDRPQPNTPTVYDWYQLLDLYLVISYFHLLSIYLTPTREQMLSRAFGLVV